MRQALLLIFLFIHPLANSQEYKITNVNGWNARLFNSKVFIKNDTISFTYRKRPPAHVKISNIEIGDKLMDGSIVTSVFQLASQHESMYEIKGIKVTGSHRIDDSTYGIIAVKDHPESQLIKDYWSPVLYSINTTSKRIPIKQFKRKNNTILEKEPLEHASKRNQMYAYKHYGFWKCMDTKRDKDVLEKIYKNKLI